MSSHDLNPAQKELLDRLTTRHGLTAKEPPKPPAQPSERRSAPNAIIGHALSDRERETLRLVSHGLTNKEIAKELFLAEETIKSHVRRGLQKLEAKNRAHAVAIGLRHGLIV